MKRSGRTGLVGGSVAALVALTACNPSDGTAESKGVNAIFGGVSAVSCTEEAGADPPGAIMWISRGRCNVRHPNGSSETVYYESGYTPNSHDKYLDVVVRVRQWRCYGTGAGTNWHFSRCTVTEG